MARPKWVTKLGRMSPAEHEKIEELALEMKKPTAGKIARAMGRHPATVNWHMLRNGLIERTPNLLGGTYQRNGQTVHPYIKAHDARLLDLRTDKPGQPRKTYREIGEILTQEFGIERDAHSVQVRMTLLAAAP